jgi:hypothetical protein
MVRYGWPSVSGLSFGPENSPPPHVFLLANPPPPALVMVIIQSDRIACLPGHVGGGRPSDTQQSLLSFRIFSNCSERLQAVGFACYFFGISLWVLKT